MSSVKNSPVFSISALHTNDYTHMIFPVNNNESFKVAFSAKSSGIKVERLKSDMKIGAEFYGKGSFVIKNNGNSKLKKIISDLSVSPGYVKISKKLNTSEFLIPRIGLVETWFHDMDTGWTRFVLDSYSIPFVVIRPSDIQGLNYQPGSIPS